ncbi:hypothetical protein BZG36_02356 [Bifiguratus adelaidae]|uniref:histidine kinase n=1 Tax=Bifiguratus adelaidae TaxID=1938954 RepID=A0A261Y2I2_9FUNG|nr:hypothetical protein BZG36_02356 [Bifiguratus adelaidae]
MAELALNFIVVANERAYFPTYHQLRISLDEDIAALREAIKPSLAHEAHLRKLFAQDRSNASLRDPYVGLVDVHGDKAGFDVLKVRRRLVDKDATKERVTEALSVPLPGGPRCDATKSDEKHVLALPDSMRREHGEALCVDRQTFLSRFAVFTEGSLSTFTQDDWQNVLVAGGSVLACLLPVPASVAVNGRRAQRKFYHEESYVGSDIDLFIYGLNEEQAKLKMERLAEVIAEGIPWDTLCVRTKHAVTIVSQYPYRNLQIILRLYASPTEVLVGFDVDACSFGFDGQRVWATPRAVAAVMTQTNSVDMSRRSFMTENPGRQMMSGSFQPLDTDDWAEQAYLKPSEVLFSNIINGRVQQVEEILVTKGPKAAEFLLERDPVGRSPLHLALLERQTEVALVLLKYGARMTSRLVDGRAAFHIAAAMGNVNVFREMLRISAENAKKAEEDRLKKKQTSNANDEDDEDGEVEDEDDGDVVIVKKRARLEPTDDISEDLVALLEPEVLDLSVATWDEGYTAMFYTVFSGSIETVQLLADAGASMSTTVKNMSLLSAALLIESDARASAMVQALIEKGARQLRKTLEEALSDMSLSSDSEDDPTLLLSSLQIQRTSLAEARNPEHYIQICVYNHLRIDELRQEYSMLKKNDESTSREKGGGWRNESSFSDRPTMASKTQSYLAEVVSILAPRACEEWDDMMRAYGLDDRQLGKTGHQTDQFQQSFLRATPVSKTEHLTKALQRLEQTKVVFIEMTKEGYTPYGAKPLEISSRLVSRYTRLFQAVWEGDSAVVRKLTLPTPGENGPLLSASILLAEENDFARDFDRRTAHLVEIAVRRQQWSVLSTLFEEPYYDSELRIVAEPRDRSTMEEEENDSEYTHNMVSVKPVKSSLEQALAVDNFDLLLFLAEHAMCFEHLQDEIVAAQEESDADVMEKPREYPGLLISAEADPTQRQQPRAQSIPILQKAVARGATNIVRKLLENNLAGVRQLLLAAQQGARTFLSESEGGMQRKGLEALLSCDTDDQKVIRKAAGLDTKDHRNLLQALAMQDVKLQTTNVATLPVIVDLLPAYVDEHLNEPEQSGEMLAPLLNAVASRCDIAMVQALIDCGAHLETRDKLGRNVLFHAVNEHQQRKHLKPEEEIQYLENVLKLLPTGIANALAMQQATNLGLPADTVLHAAKHTSKIRLLLDKLVPQTVRELLLRRNEFGQTPLAQAVSRKDYNIFKLLLEACNQHNVLQVLRWEDAIGDTPLERVERLVIQDALNDHPARTMIDPPLQFTAKIDERFVSEPGVHPNNNLIAAFDWKTIVTQLTDWERKSKERRYQLDIDDQIAELQYVLHEAAGLLTPELREACEDLLVRLQTKQKERRHDSSHPTARSLGSEPLFNDDTKRGTGINSHLRLIRRALIEAEKSYTGPRSRVKVPVTSLQLAAKAPVVVVVVVVAERRSWDCGLQKSEISLVTEDSTVFCIVQVSHLALTGFAREEYLGRSIYDLPAYKIPAPDIKTVHSSISHAINTRAVQVMDDVDIGPDLSIYNVRVTPIFEGPDLLYVTLAAHDVTRGHPLRRDKRELLYMNETYRILVDTVKDYAIFMLDTGGHVVTWNSGAAILKGYTSDEIIGRHFSIFYGHEDRLADKPGKELQVCLREGKVEDEGWRYRKDGSRFWANVMISPIFHSGRHVGYAKVTRDLTERKAAEARLIAAFEESSKLKSDFLANMSHEIRTPMHGMLLAITMLSGTNLDQIQREYASIIEDTGSILLQVINDVLDYSKLSSGTFSITPDVLDVQEIIGTVVRNCKTTLKPGVELETYIQPGFPKHVNGDTLRYRQILQNLVGNAVKFTDKGSIKIRTTFSEHKEDDMAYEVSTEVIDTGIGVPEDAASSLFTPFSRFADSSRKRYQGTGLGLSICKSLAELMEGSVGFHSNPEGQGSVFCLTAKMGKIDNIQSEARRKAESSSPDPSVEIKRIAPHKHLLLVEDNIMNQTIMLKLLNMIGFEKVDTAWHGAEAVRMVKQKPLSYNAILMDINMPVMNGVEATVAIRKMSRDVPIIAMTGNALKGDAETYLAKGMNDYIAKPVHRQHLVKVLKVEAVRRRVLKHFNADPGEYDIIFTANATASIKLVAEMFPWQQGSQYVFFQESHTSIVGIRGFLDNIPGTTSHMVSERELKEAQYCLEKGNNEAPSLFAYPAQCNFTGTRFPQSFAHSVARNNQNFKVLLDASSFCTTAALDLSNIEGSPDFVSFSFYKIFGSPTGLGGLLVKKSNASILKKAYFGGGTVTALIGVEHWHQYYTELHEKYEDGTINFLDIIALGYAMDAWERIFTSFQHISRHVTSLTAYAYETLSRLTHCNDTPLCNFYNVSATEGRIQDATGQGPILNFNMRRADGSWIGAVEVEKRAALAGVHVRTGGFCNPGSNQLWLNISPDLIKANFANGHICGDDIDLVNELPIASLRVSFGAMTSINDIDALIVFLSKNYVDVNPRIPDPPRPFEHGEIGDSNPTTAFVRDHMSITKKPSEHAEKVCDKSSSASGGLKLSTDCCTLLPIIKEL